MKEKYFNFFGKKFKSYFIDFLLMTFSVLLAFSLNSWNENRKEKKMVEFHLEDIKEEMKSNLKILEEYGVYHDTLLQNLRKNPLQTSLILKSTPVTNVAWKLAENDKFKTHIDKNLYKELAKVYFAHDELVDHMSDVSARMTELNVFGSYYSLAGDFQNLSKEDQLKFRGYAKSGWIPIFEDWTSMEQFYWKAISDALKTM